LLTN
jgi:hypothetical protein